MSTTEIVSALAQVGFRGRLAKRAAALEARNVTRRDILAVHQHLLDVDGHAPAAAVQVLDALLDDPAEWAQRVEAARSRPSQPSVPRKGGPAALQERRLREFAAHGCSTDEAKQYELGGFIHGQLCGDMKDPVDLAREHNLHPHDVVQLASSWAQRFGWGTSPMRRVLDEMARRHRDAAKIEQDPAKRGEHLQRRESFETMLAMVPGPKAQEGSPR